ncbi:MAG: hypothetical protein HQ594_05650 [Candidatus Omnitrophica bacterium]|nr:hypothetical protein [Candidatus Omnitrophota bacterium]
MKKRSYLLLLLLLFLLTRPADLFAEETDLAAGSQFLGNILYIAPQNYTDTIFVGAEDGLYETSDSGVSWRRIELPGSPRNVRGIALSKNNLFFVSDNGVCEKNGTNQWQWLPGSRGMKGITVAKRGAKEVLLGWKERELYKISGSSWGRLSMPLLQDPIEDVVCAGEDVFVFSGGDIYELSLADGSWRKIRLSREADEGAPAEDPEIENEIEDGKDYSHFGKIDSSDQGEIAVATFNGIYIIGEEGSSREKIGTTGLPSGDVKCISYGKSGLFTATTGEVFYYSKDPGSWKSIFRLKYPGSISSMRSYKADDKDYLWIAGGKHLYRVDVTDVMARGEVFGKRWHLPEEALEPSVRQVQEMAVEYAEVSPEKIRRWRAGARWKAVLPRLSMGFSQSDDANIEIYKSASKYYVIDGPRETSRDWNVDLTWDLSEIVWNKSQTIIDVRSKLMVQLRDNILEEVTRLYFERKRLLAEISGKERPGSKAIPEKQLRVEELTAYIDALTGGRFSKAIDAS